ncbi:MAG: peroxiredoxin [Candidatus Omnitrophota bacterium]
MKILSIFLTALLTLLLTIFFGFAQSREAERLIYNPGKLKPTESTLKVKIGEAAPDFSLLSTSGKRILLNEYRGKKNIVIAFIPAAWTPVCSNQLPSYDSLQPLFEECDAVLLSITVDNIPTLSAWQKALGGLWFELLSDFWPHGAVADRYGVLREDGVAERAIFVIDKKGIIRYIKVHDINELPDTSIIAIELQKLKNKGK